MKGEGKKAIHVRVKERKKRQRREEKREANAETTQKVQMGKQCGEMGNGSQIIEGKHF